MNLVVDYGNSSAKVGIFNKQELIEKHIFPTRDELKSFLLARDFQNAIVSSVSTNPEEISGLIQANKKFILNKELSLPIHNHYATPATLGVDRLAAVCGAQQLFTNQNCLVIDAGTCITFEFIDQRSNYLGGSISPGLSMRFQAVNFYTAKLPLVKAINEADLIGDSTEKCIQSGVINGMVEEINGIIQRYRDKFEDLKVVLCGGDAVFFENKMKGTIFAVPELVLSGLNSILKYNVNL